MPDDGRTLEHPECTPAQRDCPHENFRADVDVQRFLDTGLFLAEVRIACAQCELGFRFKGVPPGLAWDRPACSIEGLTLTAPIEPELVRSLFSGARYVMPPLPAQH